MLTPAMALVRLFVWLFAGCSFAGVNYGFCPWHQLLQVIVFVLRQLFENIDKIFVWIKIVRFCGLDQAEYCGGRFCSRWCFTEQEILPRYHKGLDAPFCSIVAAWKPSVDFPTGKFELLICVAKKESRLLICTCNIVWGTWIWTADVCRSSL